MAYRDELIAARFRIETLTQEVDDGRVRLGELERALGQARAGASSDTTWVQRQPEAEQVHVRKLAEALSAA